MKDQLEEYNEVGWDLYLDVELVKHLIKYEKLPESKPRLRRRYAKTLFSYIEGITYQLKQLAVQQAEIEGVVLTDSELSLMQERKFRLNDKGEAESQYDLLDLQRNIKFTAKIFAKSYASSYQASYSDNRWNSLKVAKRIRNRLSHPKTPADIQLTDDDYATLQETEEWFWGWYLDLLKNTRFHEKAG